MTACIYHHLPASCGSCGRRIVRSRQGGWMHDPMIVATDPGGHPIKPVHRTRDGDVACPVP